MPHLLTHLTSLRLMEGDENLHPLGEEALKRRRDLASLGAVLCDLPRFEGLQKRVLPTLLGQEEPPSRWAGRLHHDRVMAMGMELIRPRNGDRSLGPLARLAIGIGYMAHAALDSALHPLVNRLASAEPGSTPGRAHQRVEKYQAILMHARLTGTALQDDGVLWASLDMTHLADLPRALELAEAASLGARGASPTQQEWRAWLSGLAQYAGWARNWLPRAEGGAARPEHALKAWVEEVAYPGLLLQAQARALAWCNRLCSAFEPGDVREPELEALRKMFGEVDLEADTDPFPDHAVGVELRTQRAVARQWRAARVAGHRKDHTAMASTQLPPGRRAPPPPELTPVPTTPDAGILDEAAPPPPMLPAASDDGESYSDDGTGSLRPKGRAPR